VAPHSRRRADRTAPEGYCLQGRYPGDRQRTDLATAGRLNMNRFSLKRSSLILVFFPMLLWSAYYATSVTVGYLQNENHDLREIDVEARNFVARENARNGTNWEAGSVDPRVLVPQCVVPLKARWETRFWYKDTASGASEEHRFRVITVTCWHTWYLRKDARSWGVDIPVIQRR
jgi:hypothetical protein